MSGDELVLLKATELEAIVRRVIREELRTPARADLWFDTEKAAEFLGIHPRTLTKRAKNGEVPASRLGKLWRFRRTDLEAVLATVDER